MIRARCVRPGNTDLIILGLSAKNIEKLTDGQPVLVEAGGPLGLDHAVTIVYGRTEPEIAAMLEEWLPNLKVHKR